MTIKNQQMKEKEHFDNNVTEVKIDSNLYFETKGKKVKVKKCPTEILFFSFSNNFLAKIV
jgi:hypothetical protein